MKFTLSIKLNLFFATVVFLLLFPLTFYIYDEIKDISQTQTQNYLISLAEAVEGQIYLFFDRAKVRVGDWSSDGYIKQMAEKIIKNRNPQDAETLSRYLVEKKLPLDYSVKLLDVISPQGEIIASSELRRVGMTERKHITPEKKEEMLKAKYGEVFIEGLEKEGEEEEEEFHPAGIMFHAETPLKSFDTGETIGILLFHYDAEKLSEILSGSWQIKEGAITGQKFITKFKTSEIYLVNKDKLMITSSRFIKDAVLNQRVNTLPVRKCLEKNEEFSGTHFSYRNVEVEGASMCLSGLGMALIIEISSAEIFEELSKEKNDFILLAVLLWFLSILIGVFFSRFFLKKIVKITAAAREIIKGNFNIRTNIKSKDEIGELAGIFDKMLDQIENSQKEINEAYKELEKMNASLEDKIKIRTKETESARAALEIKVREKTLELQNKINELEKFKELTVGRELKMVELKKEIEKLKNPIK